MRPHRTRRAAVLGLVALSIAGAVACGDDPETEGDQHVGNALTAQEDYSTTAGPPDAESVEGSDPPPASAPSTLTISAVREGLGFQETSAVAAAGTITLRMPNPSGTPHNIAVEEPEPVEGEVVPQGGVSEITFTAPPGEYEYFCSVPGHREGGMEGTLRVR